MITRSIINNIPLAKKLYKKTQRYASNKKNILQLNRLIKRLKSSNYLQGEKFAEALALFNTRLHQDDRYIVEKIEGERNRLLSRDGPLNDGSLGDGGLYDNNKIIKQACAVSKDPKAAFFLFLLVRTIKPKNVVELGTNVGISSAYVGAALKLNGQNGRCISLDASPYRQRLAKEIHTNIGINNVYYVKGLFTETLNPSLLEMRSVDLAFIDGHHQYQPTLDYFEEIFKFSASDAVFVFDDIRWSDGMKKAWSQIQSDDRLGLIVDLSSVGVCVRRREASPRFVFEPIELFRNR